MIRSILIICTGNTCRSPMAEGLLKKSLQKLNQTKLKVRSAGIMANDGMPASTGSILALAEIGVDISSHKSTRLRPKLLREADLILVMERYHRDVILQLDPTAKDKVKLMKEFINASPVEMDVEDPIGSALDNYRNCALELQKCVQGFVEDMIMKGEIK